MKVLVVDDRLENRMILQTKLSAAGYQVDVAADGVEGLERMRNNAYDLVVTDLMMPRMDGYQMIEMMRGDAALKALPILVYTATYTDRRDEELALNLGANGFIVKPASDEDFFRAVHGVLQQASRGELPKREMSLAEVDYLRQYTERLIFKLENKVEQLERTRSELQQLNAELESKVQQATQQLRTVNAELEGFAYSVSHDLRAPLRGIVGYLDALLDEDAPPSAAERRDYLQRARAQALHGHNLVDEILEYARINATQMAGTPVPLDRAVRAALELIEPKLRASGEVVLRPLPSLVVAHERTLTQVIQNLLSNGLKFAKPSQRARVTVSEERRGAAVRLLIQDEGIGIPDQYHGQIFKVFERLHDTKTYAGTGVGLAIVERGVHRMGGTVGLSSQPGEGSLFWIELPAATGS